MGLANPALTKLRAEPWLVPVESKSRTPLVTKHLCLRLSTSKSPS